MDRERRRRIIRMVRRWTLILLPLLAFGCSATPKPPSEFPPYLQARAVELDNRSPWRVSLEPLSAVRVGGSMSFGPPENEQPSRVKISSKLGMNDYFRGIDDVPRGLASEGDAMLLHVEARENDRGPMIREAYIVLPRHALERTSGKVTLKVDAKGVTSGGAYVTSAPWVVTAS